MLDFSSTFIFLSLAVFLTQGAFMAIDEFYFHRQRGLKVWEAWGHPVDSLLFLSCFFLAGFSLPRENLTPIWIILAIISTLAITKDEWVHKQECDGTEQWLHALLFIIHPISLWMCYQLWLAQSPEAQFVLRVMGFLVTGFMLYQIIYWQLIRPRLQRGNRAHINNDLYEELGDRWLYADDDPVALLRAQAKLLGPWVWRAAAEQPTQLRKFLEVGCGGGLIARQVFDAVGREMKIDYTGVDLSHDALRVAKTYCPEGHFQAGDAEDLRFPNQSFDVVIAMDLLEHVQNPGQVIAEAARVLRPGGLFFFHTFNRNLLANIMVIKMVEWLVPNTPKHMHVIDLFLKPEEIKTWLLKSDFSTISFVGVEPNLVRWANLKGLILRKVPKDFSFRFTQSLRMSYAGIAVKSLDSGIKSKKEMGPS